MDKYEERDFKGIWIPKEIWLSHDLTIQEKLVLVEIDSLDSSEGCYASNEYFSEFFGYSKRRIIDILNSLSEKGYIVKKNYYRGKTKIVDKRIIKCTRKYFFQMSEENYTQMSEENYTQMSEENCTQMSEENCTQMSEENCTQMSAENCTDNNIINNKKEKRKKESEFDVLINNYTENEKLKDTLYEFIKHRKAIKIQLTTLALKKILNRLNDLAKNDDLKIRILENSIMNGWRGIFPLGKDDKVISIQQRRNQTPTVSLEIDKSKLGGI